MDHCFVFLSTKNEQPLSILIDIKVHGFYIRQGICTFMRWVTETLFIYLNLETIVAHK